MGLIYDSADSSGLISALSTNLSAARSTVDGMKDASDRLLTAVGTGELSGQGYAAAGVVFSQGVLPTLTATRAELDSLQSDLEKYRWEDSKVSRFGVLREDELTVQLKATTAQRDATEHLMEANSSAASALSALPLLAEGSEMANRRLEMVLAQLESDVRDLEDRLDALRAFDAATAGLFENGLVDTPSRRRSPHRARTGGGHNGGIQPASLTVPAPTAGATAQQIAQWLIAGTYSIGALVAACGGAVVMAAITLITLNGSTSGSRFYTPEEQVRRARLEMYYWTHNLDGSVKQYIGPVPSPFGKYFNESPTFEDVDRVVKEKTRKGKTKPHREVDTPGEVREIYEEITRGSEAVEDGSTYKGEKRSLPDGTEIGIREESTSGGLTIDIWPPAGKVIKVHLPMGYGK
jgi:hypothetical protein